MSAEAIGHKILRNVALNSKVSIIWWSNYRIYNYRPLCIFQKKHAKKIQGKGKPRVPIAIKKIYNFCLCVWKVQQSSNAVTVEFLCFVSNNESLSYLITSQCQLILIVSELSHRFNYHFSCLFFKRKKSVSRNIFSHSHAKHYVKKWQNYCCILSIIFKRSQGM